MTVIILASLDILKLKGKHSSLYNGKFQSEDIPNNEKINNKNNVQQFFRVLYCVLCVLRGLTNSLFARPVQCGQVRGSIV
jgi:hypothetical protein